MDPPSNKPKVVVVILNWNGAADTIECLHSLQGCPYPNLDVLVVDNGSTDDSVTRLRALCPPVDLVQTNANLGYAGGNNIGIREAVRRGAEYVLVLNNDTSIDSGTVQALVDVGESDPTIGLLGCYVYAYHEPSVFLYAGLCLRPGYYSPAMPAKKVAIASRKKYESATESQPIDSIHGCAFMMRAEAANITGGFDERFFLLHEELDLSWRVKNAGFCVVTVPGAVVLHKVAQSFAHESPNRRYYDIRNRPLLYGNKAKAVGKRLPPVFWFRYGLLGMKRAAKSLAKGRTQNAYADIQGTIHGMIGVTGKRQTRST